MAVKTSGAEWKRYYADALAWPDGWWHENEEISIDGIVDEDRNPAEIRDGAAVVIKGGVIFEGSYDAEGMSVEAHFRKWREAQATTFVIAEVHKDQLEQVASAIKKTGGRIVR